MLKHIVVQAIFQSIILLILTFKGDSIIKESLKDSDQKVQDRFIDGGGWDRVWENFNHGDPQNPYDTQEEMERDCPIVATKDGYIRSGRAYTNWGITYQYEPMNKVR